MIIRTKIEIKNRITEAIIEEINNNQLNQEAPEKQLPKFIEQLSTKIHILCIDEIENRRRY